MKVSIAIAINIMSPHGTELNFAKSQSNQNNKPHILPQLFLFTFHARLFCCYFGAKSCSTQGTFVAPRSYYGPLSRT
jgi:hypothetical protein